MTFSLESNCTHHIPRTAGHGRDSPLVCACPAVCRLLRSLASRSRFQVKGCESASVVIVPGRSGHLRGADT